MFYSWVTSRQITSSECACQGLQRGRDQLLLKKPHQTLFFPMSRKRESRRVFLTQRLKVHFYYVPLVEEQPTSSLIEVSDLQLIVEDEEVLHFLQLDLFCAVLSKTCFSFVCQNRESHVSWLPILEELIRGTRAILIPSVTRFQSWPPW